MFIKLGAYEYGLEIKIRSIDLLKALTFYLWWHVVGSHGSKQRKLITI